MEGPPLGSGGEDITWPDQVAPRGRKASRTNKIKPKTSNPIACPTAAHVQLQSPPGNAVTLRTAKLRQRDTCRLTVPHTAPWHGHHGPHHPFPDNDEPWPAAVRECLNQCANEHLQYSHRD